jgi:hypothetical protein
MSRQNEAMMNEHDENENPYSIAEDARWQMMRRRVKLDLAMRGLTSADLDGLEQEQAIERGELKGWTLRVLLNGGRDALVYTLDNASGARVMCGGEALADVVVQ